MVRLAVINLKTCLKSIGKVIMIVLVLAMCLKFAKLIYQAVENFDFISTETSIEMVNSNLAISGSFQEETEKTSGIKKILVAELALFSGAEEEIMEKENQEEVLEFEETVAVPESEQVVENVEEVSVQETGKPEIQERFWCPNCCD